MAKKRKAKANKNDIGMAYHIEASRPVKKAEVYAAMLESIRTGGKTPMPAGVKVTWKWRNSKKQAMRSAPFRTAIRKSRAGFMALMMRRILRDAADVPGFEAPAPLREATAKEIRAIERAEEATQEKRDSKRTPGGRESARARELKAKRSAAAKKGWVTRRKNAAAAKKAAPAARKSNRK